MKIITVRHILGKELELILDEETDKEIDKETGVYHISLNKVIIGEPTKDFETARIAFKTAVHALEEVL